MTTATQKKTVLEVYPEIYVRVRKHAGKSNQTTKRFTTFLLQYAIEKLDAGQIGLVDAVVTEKTPGQGTIKIPARKGGNMRKGATI